MKGGAIVAEKRGRGRPKNASTILSEETQRQSMLEQDYNTMLGMFAQSLTSTLTAAQQSAMLGRYRPDDAANFLKENTTQVVPTQEQITTALQNPTKNAKVLRQISRYLENVSMQYQRTINHFSQIMSFKQELWLCTFPEKKAQVMLKKRQECLDYLRKLNLPYIKDIVMHKVMREGVMFAYFEENDDVIHMMDIPSDYCIVTGQWDYGWTYAIDLTYFDNLKGQVDVLPEIYQYYLVFAQMREVGISGAKLNNVRYYPVPVEQGYVFAFDILGSQPIPPFKGVFLDATQIFTYKQLLKQRAALDTWKIVAQEVPTDDDGKILVPTKLINEIVALTQSVLPSGTATFATPLKVKELNFAQSQNKNEIIGLGESLFFRSVGVNGSLMDAGGDSAIALKYSLVNDLAFVSHIYRQFENFINLQFLIRTKPYIFQIHLYGNIYTDAEDAEKYKALVKDCNFPVGRLAGYFYPPYAFESTNAMETMLGLKQSLIPIVSGSQMSGDDIATEKKNGGRGKKNQEDLSASGERSQDDDVDATRMKGE